MTIAFSQGGCWMCNHVWEYKSSRLSL